MDWIDTWPAEFRPIIRLLAKSLDYDAIWMRRELSGASGASTYLAEPQGSAGRGTPLIVKLGEKAILDQDLAGLQTAKKFFQSANYSLDNTLELDGIRCIPMEIAGGLSGLTFKEFYAQAADPEVVGELIEKVFREVLRREELTLRPTQENVFQLYKFDDLNALARQLRKLGDDQPNLAFWWEQCRSEFAAQKSYTILSHGDLHSGNILVAGGRPYIIDFGRTGDRHVHQDLAKFEREVRLFLFPQSRKGQIAGALAELEAALQLPADDPRQTRDVEIRKACTAIKTLRRLAVEALPPQGDWQFEYYAALLAQFIFAAANRKLELPQRQAALAQARRLRAWFEERLGRPVTGPQAESRKETLWRLAYAFLRLDQLPSGGWSKTLGQWMEGIWEGDDGNIRRNPDIRSKGGTDLTSYAFHHYLRFLDRHLNASERTDLIAHNRVAHRLRDNLSSKMVEGAIAPVRANTPRRVRHTLMGLIAFLRHGEANESDFEAAKPVADDSASWASNDIAEAVKYLIENLKEWDKDSSHYWGMYASLLKLEDMLKQRAYAKQIKKRELDKLLKKLADARGQMEFKLTEARFKPQPEGTYHDPIYDAYPFFAPYFNFWRMARSNFLMYLPYLVSEDRGEFLNPRLRARCAQCLRELLDEIAVPFDALNPTASLLAYHPPSLVGRFNRTPSLDWGLSAELAAVLELPAVSELLGSSPVVEEKRRALHAALLRTFDGYYTWPHIFKFTHGVSFGRYLDSIPPFVLAPEEIKQLDDAVTRLCSEGITECGLGDLLDQILAQSGDRGEIDKPAIVHLLVDKLESGEHTPDGQVCSRHVWEGRVDQVLKTTTIEFYNGPGGESYANRYFTAPIRTFVSRIKDMVDWADCQGRKALDVGCGPGQYAMLLRDEGYEVELVDMSEAMLRMAAAELGLAAPPPPKDVYKLEQYFKQEAFDLIFACAMMVHVPLKPAKQIYRDFYHLLKPGGLLFVNFKLGDHSLISSGGRYFQYYRDQVLPANMLQEAGFEIEEVTLRGNRQNLHNDPRGTQWANFYCKKAGG